jgi:acyl-CoA synthetase (AMP-forming)/AMP-acid ligase II
MELNLADLFECVADHVPEHVAVVCGAERLNYRELDERATRVAHGFRDLGIGPGDHIGLMLRDRVEHLEAMLGAYKLRAVPVNVSFRYVQEEVAYLSHDASLVALVHGASAADRVTHLEGVRLLAVDDTGAGPDDFTALRAAGAAERDFGPRSADDHYVLYTGGTTGLPKGVVWRQEDIFFAALGGGNPGGAPITEPEQIGPGVLANPAGRVAAFLEPDDPRPPLVALATGPLIHASGQWSALGTLLSGGTVVLDPEPHFDAARLLDLVATERIVALNLVGDAVAKPLLDELASHRHHHRWDTSSLLLLGSGGSILSGPVKDALLDALPSVLAVIDGIGSSESPAQAVAVTRRGGTPTHSLRFTAKDTTIIVDDDLRPVHAGVVGRLATTGRVPLRYLGDPERSAATFVEIDGRRWALPGDMATMDEDGTVHLLGRGSLCINTGGEKVYPEEVEAVLKTPPAVADAVVVGTADPRFGEQVSAVVQADGDAPTLDELREFARTRLAGYKLPRALHVVDRVERGPTGKADYPWARHVAERP